MTSGAPRSVERRVFSLGHSTRGADEFLGILHAWRVERLVDVRRFPTSRRHPHFSRDALSLRCAREGIDYLWLGEALGGFRTGGYEAYTETDAFARGLDRLEGLATERATAFLCAERDPARCHRRYIARALERRGWAVVHILDETKGAALEDSGPTALF